MTSIVVPKPGIAASASIANRLPSFLPSYFLERCTLRRDAPLAEGPSRFVLYIALNALRAYENPSLEASRHAAAALGLPLVVHTFFSDKSLHATARRATFILEGIHELALQFDATSKTETFTFQLIGQKGASRQPAHLVLASRAAIVFIDEPFVEPHLSVVDRISRGSKSPPVVTVDAACVVPARLIPSDKCNRAYAFRSATSTQRKTRSLTSWPSSNYDYGGSSIEIERLNLPHSLFMDLTSPSIDIEKLVRDLENVNHAVKACCHTKGGHSNAIARWKNFLSANLGTYHKRRNDPLQLYTGGVSRMSAYVNMGMISPFTIARDVIKAVKRNLAGASKFLDEFGVWREMSYAWCYHNPRHRVSARIALPNWAFRTLTDHASDHGTPLALELLEKGETGLRLWDICQQSLVLNGELHNNLRMTWGKEVLRWTSGPEQAYNTLLHLNDKYALDGLSPGSIAGLLWCLGWGDSPKGSDSTRVFGRVRPRSAQSISRRYDLDKLAASVNDGPTASVQGARSAQHQTIFQAFAKSKKINVKRQKLHG